MSEINLKMKSQMELAQEIIKLKSTIAERDRLIKDLEHKFKVAEDTIINEARETVTNQIKISALEKDLEMAREALEKISNGSTDAEPPYRALNHSLMSDIAKEALSKLRP